MILKRFSVFCILFFICLTATIVRGQASMQRGVRISNANGNIVTIQTGLNPQTYSLVLPLSSNPSLTTASVLYGLGSGNLNWTDVTGVADGWLLAMKTSGGNLVPTWIDPTTISAWNLGGNSGTTAWNGTTGNILGTLDAQDLVIGTGATASTREKVRITTGGDVLIRQPNTKLSFQGTGTGLTTFEAGNQGTLDLHYILPISGPTTDNFVLTSNTTGTLSWNDPGVLVNSDFWSISGNTISAAWNGTTGNFIGTLSANPLVIATTNATAQDIRFFTGNTETMRLSGAGELGIGLTATGSRLLHVAGTAGTANVRLNSLSGSNLMTALAANDGLVISDANGDLTKRDPSILGTALTGSYVQYDLTGTQNLSAARSNYLFNVAYAGGASDVNAMGASISSTGGATNRNATALTLTASATGTGTSTALNVTAGGGSTNYAALFSGGNVGIGQTSPSQLLEVRNGNLLLSNSGSADQLQFQGTSTGITTFAAGAQGATNINYTLPVSAAAANGYVLASTTAGVMSWTDPTTLATNDWHLLGNSGTTAYNGAAGNFIGTSDAQPVVVATTNTVTPQPIEFFTNNAEKMRLSATGNLGIGQTNPSQLLEIRNGNFLLSNSGSADQLQFQGTGAGLTTFQAGAQGATNINYTLPITAAAANGYVLASTTAGVLSWTDPATIATNDWHLLGNSGTTAYNGATGNFVGTTDAQPVVVATTNTVTPQPIEFFTNNVEKMRLSATGNLGIGQTNPSQLLEVRNGNLLLSNSGSADQLQFQGTAAGITTFQAGAQGATNINYTLPITAAAANGYVLSSTTAGVLSWTDPSTIPTNDWHLLGNGGTTAYNGATGNFVGTTDAQPVVVATTNTATPQPIEFFTNNVEKMRLTSGGELGIGLTPTANRLLHVTGTAGTANIRLNSLSGANLFTAIAANDGLVISDANGDLTKRDPSILATALNGSFVQYNISAAQNASVTRTNYLFNVAYGAANDVNAAGAVITSVGGATNRSATGLSVTATATGTGTSTAFSATAGGGGTNYAALFSGGNVGVGQATPSQLLEVRNGNLLLSNSASAGQLQFQGTSTGITTFAAGAQGATNINYTLPISAAVANGYVLSSTTAGVLSWTDPATFASNTSWLLAGNATASAWNGAAGNFLGTSTTQPLVVATTNTATPQPIEFFTNNVEKMRLSATGNLGIGQTNPSQLLEMRNGNLFLSNSGSADQLQFQGTSSGITTFAAGAQGATNINYTLPISAAAANGYVLSSTTAGVMSWIDPTTLATNDWHLTGNTGTTAWNGATGNIIGTLDAQDFVIGTGAVAGTREKVRVTQAGNLQLSQPGTQLSFLGTSTGVTTFQAGAQGATNINYTLPISAAAANGYILSSTTAGVLSWTDPSTLPINDWHLIGNATASAWNGAAGSFLGTTSTQPLVVATTNTATPQPIEFFTNNVEKMRLSATGNLGIGQTNPSQLLEVRNGNLLLSNSGSADQLQFQGTSTGISTFAAGAQGATNINYTLPISAAAANGYVLSSTTAGVMSWVDPATFASNTSWLLAGNATASAWNGAAGNFLGTTTTQPLVVATTNTTTPQPIEFFTNNVEKMRLTSGGELGIGLTPTAGRLLHVTGTAGTANIRLNSLSGANLFTAIAANDGLVISDANGDLTKRDPSILATALNGSFVQYNISAAQNASVTRSNYLFNVAYGAANDVNAAGAVITSVGGATNKSATGLSVTATATGTGTSTGLSVTSGGGGTNYAALFSGGNVGIGQATPSQLLEVRNGNLLLSNSASAGQLQFQGTAAGITTFAAGAQGATNINYTLPISAAAANGYILSSTTAGVLSWTDPSTLPINDWHLIGNATASAWNGAAGSFLGTTSTQPLVVATTNTATPQPIEFFTNNVEKMRLSATGNLGINQTNPSQLLEVRNGNLLLSNSGSADQLQFQGTSTGISTFAAGAQGATNINYTLPISAAAANGYVLASTTAGVMSWTDPATFASNTSWLLAGNATASAWNGAAGNFLGTTTTQPLVVATTNTTTPQPIEFFTNNTEKMRLTSGGELGIGLTPTSNRLLHVAGTAGTANIRLNSLSGANLFTAIAANDGLVISDANGDLTKRDPSILATALNGSFVQYNISAAQNASVTRTNYLFNVAYGAANDVNAAGAVITSVGGATNRSATGLSVTATATGTGTSTAFSATAGGGGTNYAALFSGGNVGIGQATPSQLLEVRNGNLLLSNSSSADQLQFQGTSTGITTFAAGAQGATNINYTLPISAAAANGYVLSSTTAGVLSWTDPATFASNTSWLLAGNATASAWNGAAGNFLGTTTTQPLVVATTNTTTPQPIEFFTNNVEKMRLSATGNLGIGQTNPSQLLEVRNGNMLLSNSASAGQLQFQGTSTGITTFAAGAQGATNINYTLPITAAAANNYVLTSTTAGVLSWTDPATLPPNDWHLTGNTGTTAWNGATGNIIGTLDAQDFVIGTGAVAGTREKVRVTQAGNLQLSQPGTQLSFLGTSTGVTTFQAGAQGANTYNLTLPITTPTVNQVLGVSAVSGATPFAVTLAWQNSSSGSFVNYNTSSAQNTAVITSPNYLFNVAYASSATTNNALGAVISSSGGTSGVTNATGLTVTSTANSTGTSTALSVTASGGSTQYAALFNGGRVGIGQATPSQLLEVRNGNLLLSNSGAADQLQFQGTSTGVTTFAAGAQGATNINYTLPISAAAANGYVLTSTTAGVLSWTDPATLPPNDWHLLGNSGTTAYNGATGNFVGTTDVQPLVVATTNTTTPQPIEFFTNNVEKMRLSATGNLGIGQTNPSQLLEVRNGNMLLSNSASAGQLQFQGTSTGITTFQAGAQGATNINYTLPIAAAAANSYVLTSTTGGVLSWTDPATLPPNDWHLTGNTGTTAWNGATGNIIGTLDAQDFVIGTGAVAGTREKVRITQAGNLQLSQPGTQLSFLGTSTGVTTFQAGAQGANTYNLTLPITTPTVNQVLGVSAVSGATPFAVTLAWQTPSAAGSFVNYNTASVQNTAVITAANYLFNVAYAASATTNNALGAVISSSSGTSGITNATGLTVTSTANSTGISTGLNVTASGGGTQYAALFNGGRVGIGQTTPSQLLEVRNGNLLLSNSGAADQLQFQGTSTGITTFAAGAQGATNINYTLPISAAAANGYVLSSTTAGVLSWTDPSTLLTSDWHLTGNTGTTAWNGATGNIIGTLDAQDFVIGTGATAATREKVRVTQAGNLQLSQPGTQLSFLGTSTGTTTLQAGAQGANTYNLTLPITTPVANQVLGVSAVSGATPFAVTLAWQNAGGAGSYVNYNTASVQNTAVVTSPNYLFNVAYAASATTNNALGAVISSTAGTATNSNATGLAVTATAHGTGTSTALNVTAGGGSTNYAALFNGGRVGIGNAAPVTGLDLSSDLATREFNYSTAMPASSNDMNFDAAGNLTSLVRIASAAAAYTLTGLAGGQNGKLLTIYNATAQQLSLANQSASSAAANRIITGTGGTLNIPTGGSVDLKYSPTDSRWFVTSLNDVSLLATGTYVNYNTATAQNTAIITSPNYLYNVAYAASATTNNALGAIISSSSGTSGITNATGLTISATANSTGISTGLSVTAGGGGTNYAALFQGGKVGVGTATPATALDVAQDFATREYNYATALGVTNNDMNFDGAGNLTSLVRLASAAAGFTITGMTGGQNGKYLTIYNATNQIMTIANQNAGSVAANRIVTGTAVNIPVPSGGSIQLSYSATDSRWVVRATSGVAGWLYTGNSGLTDGVNNFHGTLDNVPIRFVAGSTGAPSTKMVLDINGNLLFGKNSGNASFTIGAGRVAFGDSLSTTRLNSVPTFSNRVFNMIDPSSVVRIWRFNSNAGGTDPAIELIGGTNDNQGNAANHWWDVYATGTPGVAGSGTGGQGEHMSFRRRTGAHDSEYLAIFAGGNVGIGNNGVNPVETPDTRLVVRQVDGATNSVSDLISLRHTSTGNPTTGFGGAIVFKNEDSTVANQETARISGLWTNANHVNRTGALTFSTVNTGTTAEAVRIAGNGYVGVGTTVPAVSMDINGAFATEAANITLSNGTNNNLANLGNESFVRIVGPTAAFSITGIAGGSNGQWMRLVNTTGKDLTIMNQNASSNAGNRISTATGTDILLRGSTNTTADLIYDASNAQWILGPTSSDGITGPVGSISYKTKAADQTIANSVVVANDNDLSFNTNPNETWEFSGELHADNTAANINIKIAFTIPAGATMKIYYEAIQDGGVTGGASILTASGVGKIVNIAAGTSTYIRVHGIVRNTGTGGTVQFKWAQGTANATGTILRKDSFVKATRVD